LERAEGGDAADRLVLRSASCHRYRSACQRKCRKRLNAVYEKSNTFRDFGHLVRCGFNPTITWKPDASTKIRLSYEHFHDERTADRGNPSQH
jgi:outer membrane receptor for monomeric catechols